MPLFKAASSTLVLLGTYTADGTTALADFTGISAGYKNLRVIAVGRTVTAAFSDVLNLTVNGLTTAIYDRQRVAGANTTSTISQSLAQTSMGFALNGDTAAASTAGSSVFEILDYAGTTFHKKVQGHVAVDADGAFSQFIGIYDGSIRLTAAINRVTLTAGGNMKVGTKIHLYGVS